MKTQLRGRAEGKAGPEGGRQAVKGRRGAVGALRRSGPPRGWSALSPTPGLPRRAHGARTEPNTPRLPGGLASREAGRDWPHDPVLHVPSPTPPLGHLSSAEEAGTSTPVSQLQRGEVTGTRATQGLGSEPGSVWVKALAAFFGGAVVHSSWKYCNTSSMRGVDGARSYSISQSPKST